MDVANGQLNLEFKGDNWACSVSAVVIYPVAKAAEGERFLRWVKEKRRFYFDNYFKRILHRPTGDPLHPQPEERQRGYVIFQRDFMRDLYYNDTPLRSEIGRPLAAQAFAGQYESLTLGLLPLKDLGQVTLTTSDLQGPGQTIPGSAIDLGVVSYRLSRVTMEGTVYTIRPRLILPTNSIAMPKGITRQFWLTLKTPADAKPGLYQGRLTVSAKTGGSATIPLSLMVRRGTLDPIDIPAGPWGYSIPIPWYGEDSAAADYKQQLTVSCLRKLREYGFTMCSGIPTLHYGGFKDGRPVLDFTVADAQMTLAKDLGFLAVCAYGGGLSGIDSYFRDEGQMRAAGFSDYSAFINAVYGAVQQHAEAQGWIPVYWNLADEPLGDDVKRSTKNAAAYKQAFPKGPPFFTGATSFRGDDRSNPHFQLAQAFQIADWNEHDEASVRLLHQAGGDWAFYNGGQPLDLRILSVQSGQTVRHEVPPFLALECHRGRPLLCPRLPGGRLCLVQCHAGRAARSVHPIRAVARRAG